MRPSSEWTDLSDRVAIVTGASAGIGAATARALAARGAQLALVARRADRLANLANELASARQVATLIVPADLSDRRQVDDMVEQVLQHFGHIDLLVNNAGLGLQGDVALLPERELRYLFDVNVFAPQFAMQAVIPIMRLQGRGIIVNISSILAKVTLPSLGMVGSSAGYTASKAALQAFSLAARMELADAGIRVITVLPGVTRSEFNDQFMSSETGERSLSRRSGSLMGVTPPEHVARAILRGIERNQREVYVTWKDRLFVWGANAAPGLFEWAMIRLRRRRLAGAAR